MYCKKQSTVFPHLRNRFFLIMRRHDSVLKALRAAMREAARNLETLKLTRVDDDPRVSRLLQELRSATADEDSDCEMLTSE